MWGSGLLCIQPILGTKREINVHQREAKYLLEYSVHWGMSIHLMLGEAKYVLLTETTWFHITAAEQLRSSGKCSLHVVKFRKQRWHNPQTKQKSQGQRYIWIPSNSYWSRAALANVTLVKSFPIRFTHSPTLHTSVSIRLAGLALLTFLHPIRDCGPGPEAEHSL